MYECSHMGSRVTPLRGRRIPVYVSDPLMISVVLGFAMRRALLRRLSDVAGRHLRTARRRSSTEAIPASMKAALVHHHRDTFSIEDVPVPEPGPDQVSDCDSDTEKFPVEGEGSEASANVTVANQISLVLVRIHSCGVCHTDVHTVEGDWPIKSKMPLIPGHEGAGVVVKTGPRVTHVQVGDRVGVSWLHQTCGTCEYCLSGWETLCARQLNSGFSVDGCFAEFALARAQYVARLPDSLSFEQAAPILCAGVTTYKGLKMTEARAGQSVCILGAGGGLGYLAVQYAKALGLKVVAVDMGEEKLEFCRSLGADVAIDADDPQAVRKVKKATSGGCHGVLTLASDPTAPRQAISFARSGATVVCVGLPPGDFAASIFETVLKGLTIRGSIVGTRQDMVEALRLAAEGKVRSVVERAQLSDISSAYERVKHGRVNGRIVIDMDAGRA